MKKIFKVFLLSLPLIWLSGCSGKKSIEGQWNWYDGAGEENSSITFQADGKVVAHLGEESLEGTYEVLNEEEVITFWNGGEEEEILYRLENDKIAIGGSYPVIFKKK